MKIFLVLFLTLVVHNVFPVLAQTEISFGENLQDAIACQSTDTFTFAADADDLVVIHVVELSDFGGVCGGACFCFDQLVELRDAEDHVLADGSSPTSNNNQGRFRTQVGPTRVLASATYTLKIRDKQNNGRGEYRLFLQRVNAPGYAELIHSGDNYLYSLARGAVATFQFDALAGDHAAIEMSASDVGNLKPRLALYDPSGQAIALPNSGSIEIVLEEGGLFTLLAFSEVDQSGDYRLNLEVEPCESDEDCLHLSCTTATCNLETGDCEETVNSGHCLIDGLCFDDGEQNQDNECELCDSEIDPLGWTPAMSGTPCGDQTDDGCTDPDSCDAAVCLANDVVCDDQDMCNGIETCDSVDGCQSGTPLDCDDGNACTDDTCDLATGCLNSNNTLACDDGNACTTIDICADGACAGTDTSATDCDDGNACTDDSCDPATGCLNSDNTLACDDGNLCTDDSCDPATGCLNSSNTLACDDDNACTTIDICADGVCAGTDTSATDCDDGNLCTDDSCDPATGCLNISNTFDCDDGNACTDDSCDDDEGGCVHIDNTDSCDDGEACTTNDVCFEGICTGSRIVSCVPCTTTADCTAGLECSGGQCQPAQVEPCLADENCTEAGGSCVNGGCRKDCGGDADCSVGETCVNGHCFGSCAEDADCDDGVFCNGEELCIENDCQAGSSPCNEDLLCDEPSGICTEVPLCGSGLCTPAGGMALAVLLGLMLMRSGISRRQQLSEVLVKEDPCSRQPRINT